MISVVIPVYNCKDFLPEAIESVLTQEEKPTELIVVDDGSTDGSGQLADSYPIRVIHQVNKGLSSARNTGIMNANPESEYIFFLDSDDVLLPNCIKRVKEVAKSTKADVVAPSFEAFGPKVTVGSGAVILMKDPQLKDFVNQDNKLAYCTAIKREALLEVGGYSPRMVHGYEDLHLWFNLLSRGKKVVTIPEILWRYRTHQHSMIDDAQQHHGELMAQIKKDFPHAYE